MRRRLTRIGLAVLALTTLAVGAQAYWSASGVGAASAGVGSLSAATISVPSTAANSVLVSWSAQALLAPAANSSITYVVERKLGSGSFVAVGGGGCAGALAYGTTSCTDSPAATASYTYRVVATYHSWTARSSAAGPVSVTVDTTAPTVTSLVRADGDPTKAATLHWTVTFSENVVGVDASDFALATTGGVSGGSITSVTGSGASYTVTASSGTGSGTLRLNLSDDDSITDAVANPLSGAGNGNGNFTGQAYVIDRTPPSVSSIARADSDPTNASTLHWTVTFSESVTGVDSTDFALASTGGVSGGSISSVSGSGTTYAVASSTGSGEGTLGLNLLDDDTINDPLANVLGGAGTGNGNFTGQTYTIDRTAPTLSTLQMLDTNNNGRVDQVKATFSETLASSTATAPWTMTNVPSGGTLASVSTSGAVATLTITEGAGAISTVVGSFTLTLASNATGIRDPAGNQSAFAATAPADLAPPVRTAMLMTDSNANGKIDHVTVTFSETLATYTAGTTPWTLAAVPSGGTLASVSTSTTVATLVLTEGAGAQDTAVGSFTLALATSATGIRDAAGNQSFFAATAPADGAGPVPVAVSDTNGSSDGLVQPGDTFIVTFSEAIASGLPGSTPITESQTLGAHTVMSISGFMTGTQDMGTGDYFVLTGSATYAGTSALTNANKTVTITVGACSGLCLNLLAGSGTTMPYVPAPGLVDAAGNAATGSKVTGFKIF